MTYLESQCVSHRKYQPDSSEEENLGNTQEVR